MPGSQEQQPRDAPQTQFRDRLDRILERLHAHLKTERVLPYPSVQYLFSEVGPAFYRLDPRELQVALRLLAVNTARDESLVSAPVFEPRPGIFAAVDGSPGHIEQQAELSAATKEEQLITLAEEVGEERVTALAERISSSQKIASTEIIQVDRGATEPLGGSARWSIAGSRFNVPSSAKGVSVWLTNNINWLFPDDPSLWRHLVYSANLGLRPVIVARKMAISTFPLLKRVGAFGLQLHHLYLTRLPKSELAKRALIVGPPMRVADEIESHLVVQELLPSQITSSQEDVPGSQDAIGLGRELGLDQDNVDTTAAIRKWADMTDLAMPPRWKAQLTRYERWRSSQ